MAAIRLVTTIAGADDFSGSLTDQYILKYDAGTADASDSSGNDHDGTLVGSPTFSAGTAGFGERINTSNGNYVSVPTHADFDLDRTNMTIEARIKTAASDVWIGVLNIDAVADGQWIFGINSANKAGFIFIDSAGATVNSLFSSASFNDNVEHVLRCTKNGNALSLYVDDMVTPVDTHTISTGIKAMPAVPLTIGDLPGTFAAGSGSFDEVRLSDVVRSDSTAVPFTADANTLALYHFDTPDPKFVLANTIKGATDVSLFVIDHAKDQVCVGTATVDAHRKFFVQSLDANNVSTGNQGHTAFEADHYGLQTADNACNNSAIYGALNIQTAVHFTGRNAAVKGNGYFSGVGNANVDYLNGGEFRVWHQGTGTVQNAFAIEADGTICSGGGVVVNSVAFMALPPSVSGGGSITNAYVLRAESFNAATNNYGIYLNDNFNGGSIATASGKKLTIKAGAVVSIGAAEPGASATIGELELTGAGKGIILTSANGTRYRTTVSNLGVLVTVAA